jgi:glutamine synthetase
VAGIIVAAQHGLQMPNALEMAEKLYVGVNIFDDEHKDQLAKLECLPQSCWESADKLIEKRDFFEKNGVFPAGAIDQIANKLKSYEDKDLSERLYGKDDEIKELVMKHIHCM